MPPSAVVSKQENVFLFIPNLIGIYSIPSSIYFLELTAIA